MPVELKVPSVGESITEVQIGAWLKREGEPVRKDETLVEIESDKATVELPAPADGVLTQIAEEARRDGARRRSDRLHGRKGCGADCDNGARRGASDDAASRRSSPSPRRQRQPARAPNRSDTIEAANRPWPAQPQAAGEAAQLRRRAPVAAPQQTAASGTRHAQDASHDAPQASRRRDHDRAGRRRDRRGRRSRADEPDPAAHRRAAGRSAADRGAADHVQRNRHVGRDGAARREPGACFKRTYGVKLGFMSFFVKAVVDALKHVPRVNAEIRGTDIVYRNYYDIGIAVGGGKGLVVPVLRNAERIELRRDRAGHRRLRRSGPRRTS